MKQTADHQQHLGINQRVRSTGHFGTDLMELTVTAFLWTLMAKHGAHIVEFVDAIQGIQFMFDQCPHHAGRSFRPQGQTAAPLVRKGIHLLFNNIGGITNRTAK
ncbi:hypothetical protein SDC9_207829 [bioreactor metagenome]|uniref:Uncharacterized protein n=1 Tax=bioreactor metagenome TaxID=1076179 RepID=A0A645JIE3_9ZZZZ